MNITDFKEEVTSLAVILIGYWVGRKARDFSEKKEGAGAIKALQEVYDNYIAHDRLANKELLDRIESLEKHNIGLQKSFNDVLLNYNNLINESRKTEAQYLTLYKDHEKLKVDHASLKQEFEDYKRLTINNGESAKVLKKDD
jgi:succinate dehydrogenase/fumarate reductase flavoprotein subunit